ncbi:hypothetical protein TrVGV298_008294 [Trichoderma virens]|nr:hypothetical protein TrVGV298_008294 [Trichoderma virens]UKZ80266.1 hypothetical protein TrVFT333_008023 [Trichoderma virens FT-333]
MGRGRRICGGPQQVNTLSSTKPLLEQWQQSMRSITGRAPVYSFSMSGVFQRSTHNNTLTLIWASGGRHVVDNSAGVGITMSLCAGSLVDVDTVG